MRVLIISVHRANRLFFVLLSLLFLIAYIQLLPAWEEFYYLRNIPVTNETDIEPDFVVNAQNVPISKNGYFIKIDLDALLLEVYNDGILRESYPASGGMPDWPSPVGVWRIHGQIRWGSGFGGAWLSLKFHGGATGSTERCSPG
jgi:hypothetical protein